MAPWVEKYRPKLMNDVCSQEHVIKTLQSANSVMPHLLFYGPPGTGKTSTILAVAKELFGPELVKTRVLELNASDDRKIDVVRGKIKGFACRAIEASVPGYPCPPFNLIILDEADCMTQDAQNALRRTIEDYSHITRFCFICNCISRITDPLVSRCAKFRFKPISGDDFQMKIDEVCMSEKITLADNARNLLIKVCAGDLRKAITMLQSCYNLYGNSTVPLHICKKQLQEVAGVIPRSLIKDLLQNTPLDGLKVILEQGYSANEILLEIYDIARNATDITDLKRAFICKELSIAEKRLIDGGDEYLQLGKTLMCIQKILLEDSKT